MFVKKVKINRDELNDDTAVDIPLDMDHQQVDNTDIIKRDFVEEETQKKINPIIDYDKFRFKPYYVDDNGNLNEIKVVNFNLYFLVSGSHTANVTTYDQINFDYNDLKFRKNFFTNSFLRLNFYDTDVTTDQNLLTFSDLFCTLKVPTNDSELSNSDINNNNFPKEDLDQIPVNFELTNPSLTRDRVHEGVHLFWYENVLPQEFYMAATFNNAKNGESTDFMNTSGQIGITQLVNNLHTKFILNKSNNTYYYVLDRTYSNNINVIEDLGNGNSGVEINLYEVNVS